MFNSLFSRTKSYEDLGSAEFSEGLKNNKQAVLLDVRTSGEYRQGHIPKSKNVDIMGMDFQRKVEGMDKNIPYYVYCRSGARSARACNMMKKMGFEEVYNLSGGISAWGGKITR